MFSMTISLQVQLGEDSKHQPGNEKCGNGSVNALSVICLCNHKHTRAHTYTMRICAYIFSSDADILYTLLCCFIGIANSC